MPPPPTHTFAGVVRGMEIHSPEPSPFALVIVQFLAEMGSSCAADPRLGPLSLWFQRSSFVIYLQQTNSKIYIYSPRKMPTGHYRCYCRRVYCSSGQWSFLFQMLMCAVKRNGVSFLEFCLKDCFLLPVQVLLLSVRINYMDPIFLESFVEGWEVKLKVEIDR